MMNKLTLLGIATQPKYDDNDQWNGAEIFASIEAEREKDGVKDDPHTTRTIRKAMPFEVDCIVPKEFSDMFHEEPTKM